jgi:TolB-like protein/Tfp pilus assembly protein PilF
VKGFLSELQRRHVYKVGAMYAVAGWLLAQVVTQVLPVFNVSMLGQRVLVLMLIAGFPVALVLAWIFDLTPLGIVRTDAADAAITAPLAAEQQRALGQRLNYVLGGLLLILIGYLVLEHTVLRRDGASTVVAAGKSVAVMPFENFGGDPRNAYFVDGIRDEILTKLAGLKDLKVISRTSADRYKSRPENLKTVAAELGVSALLEGSVQMVGDAVHINVQLIDAQTDAHLWAETYDRPLTNAFAVEGEVGLAVAQAMHSRLAPAQADALSAAPTTNSLAYDSLLKGESQLRQVLSNEDDNGYVRAAEFFQDAVTHDPQFVQGYARLASALLSMYWNDHKKPAELLARAKAAVDQALALGPNSAAAHLAYGYYYYYGQLDYSSADIEFKRTLALQPQNTEARVALALIERRQGHWEKACEWLDQALQLDPLNPGTLKIATTTFATVRNYVPAAEWIERRRKIDPEATAPIEDAVYNLLARTGDVDGAMRILDDLPLNVRNKLPIRLLRIRLLIFQRQFKTAADAIEALPEHGGALDDLAFCYERLREPDKAKTAYLQALKNLDALAPAEQQTIVSKLWRAKLLAGLGRDDEAVVLTKAVLASIPESQAFNNGASNAREQAAEVYAALKRPADAVVLLQGLLSEYAGLNMYINGLKIEPVWDPIHDDPAFQTLLSGGQASSVSNPVR